MNKSKLAVLVLILADVILILFLLLNGKNIQLLNPKGIISESERNLIYTAGILMLGALIPVFILTGFIASRFKAGNPKGKHDPESKSRIWVQLLWWAFPSIIIVTFAAITWNATHKLDPYKPISSGNKPVVIEVVALEWKWLFIYPEENIGAVNFVQFPVNAPVTFVLTADAPMNSFWIPQLSGQMYAMAGMSTKLNLAASEIGDYRGSAAEINGKGFSDMNFTVRVSSKSDYRSWIKKIKTSGKILNFDTYSKLAAPSTNNKVEFYSPIETGLYENVIMKYTNPPGDKSDMGNMKM